MQRWLSVTVAAVLGLTSVGGWFFYSPMPEASPAASDRRTVTVGGRERHFLVVAPPAVQAGAPVLIVLHGSLMDGGKMRGMLGPRFERLARQHGAVVVYPSGVEGTDDPINPYGGGRVTIFGFGDRGTVLSAPASARWFGQRAGLAADPVADVTRRIGDLDVHQQDWGTPARVRLVTMQGAGHTVPQPDYRFPKFLGATVQADSILDEAWGMLNGR